jgi:hypothetical protein
VHQGTSHRWGRRPHREQRRVRCAAHSRRDRHAKRSAPIPCRETARQIAERCSKLAAYDAAVAKVQPPPSSRPLPPPARHAYPVMQIVERRPADSDRRCRPI